MAGIGWYFARSEDYMETRYCVREFHQTGQNARLERGAERSLDILRGWIWNWRRPTPRTKRRFNSAVRKTSRSSVTENEEALETILRQKSRSQYFPYLKPMIFYGNVVDSKHLKGRALSFFTASIRRRFSVRIGGSNRETNKQKTIGNDAISLLIPVTSIFQAQNRN